MVDVVVHVQDIVVQQLIQVCSVYTIRSMASRVFPDINIVVAIKDVVLNLDFPRITSPRSSRLRLNLHKSAIFRVVISIVVDPNIADVALHTIEQLR